MSTGQLWSHFNGWFLLMLIKLIHWTHGKRSWHVLRIIAKSNAHSGDQKLQEEILQRLIDSKLMGPTTEILFHHDPQRLALRELPHGCWSNVFVLYRAHCRSSGEPPAAKSTFFAVSQSWRCCMRFHKKTQHSLRVTCSRLKMEIRNSKES